MKKLAGIIALMIIAIPNLFAQWTTSGNNIYNSNSGNVGVGTTSPIEKLHVQSGNLLLSGTASRNTIQGTVKFSTVSYPAAYAGIAGQTNNGGLDQLDLLFYTGYSSASEKMRLMSNSGYLGIGTSAPLEKLHVQSGNIMMSGINAFSTVQGVLKFADSSYPNAYAGIAGMTNSAGRDQLDLIFYTASGTAGEKMRIMANTGNVGIGTSAPATKLSINGNVFIGTQDANTATYMGSNNLLGVNGTAVFVKAKVATYGSSWPDYVFDSSYKLMPLADLENYIRQNKHLPGVPSENEVKKDGLDLGANQATLLKKIEELTLMVIEQNKAQSKLEKKIEKQEKEIKRLSIIVHKK